MLARKLSHARALARSFRLAVSPRGMSPLERTLHARVTSLPRCPRIANGTVVFDAGAAGSWSVRVQGGTFTVERGAVSSPTATLYAGSRTFAEVIEGHTPGARAFLDGHLFMRGNIGYALELDALLQTDVRTPRVRRVDVQGIESFVLEAGPRDAPPVVLFHGLGATGASFLTTLWELARDHRVIAPDFPGFGASAKPVRRLHAAFFAKWALGLLDAMDVREADLVGNSMGGRVAIELALRSPERVGKLALFMPSLAWHSYRKLKPVVQLLRPELGALPLPMLHGLVVATLRSMFAVPDRLPEGAMNAAADEFVRVFASPRGRISFFHAAREIFLEDARGERGFWDRLPRLDRPSLFLFGERDWLVPPRFAEHVRTVLPHAEVEVVHDCGHVPQFEHPEETHARVRRFFGRDGDAPAR